MLEDIFIAIGSGLIASLAFYNLLAFAARPKVEISEKIAKPDNDKYEIKIINKTSSDIVEIKFQFF